MAEGTFLLMTSERPYAELGEDERILIGGMQERGFAVERLELPKLSVTVTASVIPTKMPSEELIAAWAERNKACEETLKVRKVLNRVTWWMLVFLTVNVVLRAAAGDTPLAVAYLVCMGMVLMSRFLPVISSKGVR